MSQTKEQQSKYFYEAFKNLFITKEDADMVFVIHGKELSAHKLIVQSRSPALRAMIRGDMAPADNRYPIDDPDITFEDFENFVEFLYTDNCEVNEENVKSLMRLGDMYDIQALLEACANEIVVKWLNADNIFKYAELGLSCCYSCSLLDKCFLAVAKKSFHVDGLTYKGSTTDSTPIPISQDLALAFVKKCSRKFQLKEENIFKMVLHWGQILTDNQVDLKTIMKPILHYFKFDQMKPLFLATHVYQSNLVSAEKLCEIICKAIIASSKPESSNFVIPKLYGTRGFTFDII